MGIEMGNYMYYANHAIPRSNDHCACTKRVDQVILGKQTTTKLSGSILSCANIICLDQWFLFDVCIDWPEARHLLPSHVPACPACWSMFPASWWFSGSGLGWFLRAPEQTMCHSGEPTFSGKIRLTTGLQWGCERGRFGSIFGLQNASFIFFSWLETSLRSTRIVAGSVQSWSWSSSNIPEGFNP